VQRQMQELEDDFQRKMQEVNDRWTQIANGMTEQTLTPLKKDIHIEIYGVGWVPHYYVNAGGQALFVSAFM
jgi:hypothetical protein